MARKATFDPDRPVVSVKSMISSMVDGYTLNIQGLLKDDGSVLPLPSESSVIGKILEESIIRRLLHECIGNRGLEWTPAPSSRAYPDLTLHGPEVGNMKFALDVKCARRAPNGQRTKSAIAILTYDAEYFRYPDEAAGNAVAPYGNYRAHFLLIALYDYRKGRVENVQLAVVEKWRVGRRKRASGTRCYVAAQQDIPKLIGEDGEFESEEEFNDFWRSMPIKDSKAEKWKKKWGY